MLYIVITNLFTDTNINIIFHISGQSYNLLTPRNVRWALILGRREYQSIIYGDVVHPLPLTRRTMYEHVYSEFRTVERLVVLGGTRIAEGLRSSPEPTTATSPPMAAPPPSTTASSTTTNGGASWCSCMCPGPGRRRRRRLVKVSCTYRDAATGQAFRAAAPAAVIQRPLELVHMTAGSTPVPQGSW
jgi:hypothetical protein